MSFKTWSRCGLITIMRITALPLLFSVATVSAAQDEPFKKWEIYGGYSMFDSCSDLHAINPGAVLPLTLCMEPIRRGLGATVTYNLNRWAGISADFSGHWRDDDKPHPDRLREIGFFNASVGPKLTYRRQHFAPFVEALVGWHRLSTAFGSHDNIGFMAGGGIDVPLTRNFALRLARADYVYSRHQFGDDPPVPTTKLCGVRLQAGVMFMFGDSEPALPVTAACSINPSEVTAGQDVTATAAPSNFNPKHTLTYVWSSTGGTATGNGPTALIDTAGLAPGTYTVTARITDPRSKSAGEASCSSILAVREVVRNPPTVSCSPDPGTIEIGGSSTITANASSPDGRPLTYNYSTNMGSVSGTTERATLNSAGASAGSIIVTCNVQDDRGLTASATTMVTVEGPPAPPAAPPTPEASRLNQIDFAQNSPRVDNAAKAVLDDVALRMQRDPDAGVVLVGQTEASERGGVRLASRRAVNTKAYLTKEKGIDASRVAIRSGKAGTMQTEVWLVPPGATFNEEGTSAVPERR